jgi:hypothetical protein
MPKANGNGEAPLKTKFKRKSEQIRIHIQEFTCRMQNTGLYQEFQIRLQENDRLEEIPEDDWTLDHPLRWQTANFLENFSAVTYQMLLQERERIDDTLMMIHEPPLVAEDVGAKELASKQHSMWIAKLLDNSWSDSVTSDMSAFDEETKGDGILLFCVFLTKGSKAEYKEINSLVLYFKLFPFLNSTHDSSSCNAKTPLSFVNCSVLQQGKLFSLKLQR